MKISIFNLSGRYITSIPKLDLQLVFTNIVSSPKLRAKSFTSPYGTSSYSAKSILFPTIAIYNPPGTFPYNSLIQYFIPSNDFLFAISYTTIATSEFL